MSTNSDSLEQLTKALEAVPRLKELAWRSPERVVGSREFQKWREGTTAVIADMYGPESAQARSFAGIQYAPTHFYFGASDETYRQVYFRGLDVAATTVQAMIEEMREHQCDQDASSTG